MKLSRESRVTPRQDRRSTESQGVWMPAELEDELNVKVELIEHQDYPALVAYLEGIVDRRPADDYAVKDLGEAYVMNGQAERTLELLTPLYRRAPHFEAVRWVILDALFALGRDERSFEWVEVPRVVRLDAETVDACFRILAQEWDGSDVEGLYCRLLDRGYCAFSEEELLAALLADGRFVVEGDDLGVWIRADRSVDSCQQRVVDRGRSGGAL